MDKALAPTYNYLYGNYWVLWYAISNSYSIVDDNFKSLLDLYFDSESESTFLEIIQSRFSEKESDTINEDIKTYLHNCNTKLESDDIQPRVKMNKSFRKIQKNYLINHKPVTVYYDSSLVLKTVHPQLAHLESTSNHIPNIVFDLYLLEDYLYLFKNETCLLKIAKQDYHFLRGKFITQIICEIHNKAETDWLGTFHGSTVTDDNTSILFIGQSGSGKSTLSSILVANGYYLLADDVSPILAENTSIYYNPNGISIKASATTVLKPLIKKFEDIPTTEFNPSKGQLRYYAGPKPPKDFYSCKSIILVDYSKYKKTELNEVTIKDILETLIPESWLSPNSEYAKIFLNWLKGLNFYKVTYSDSDEMVEIISKIFKEQS